MGNEDPGVWAPPTAPLLDQTVEPGAARGLWPSLVRIVFSLSLVPTAFGLVSQVGVLIQTLRGTYSVSFDEMILSIILCIPAWGISGLTLLSSALGRRVTQTMTVLLSTGGLLLIANWIIFGLRAT